MKRPSFLTWEQLRVGALILVALAVLTVARQDGFATPDGPHRVHERARDLIDGVLVYARAGELSREPVMLGELMAGMALGLAWPQLTAPPLPVPQTAMTAVTVPVSSAWAAAADPSRMIAARP